jgi:cell fate regulator YaaT (PSP1 superfamily)
LRNIVGVKFKPEGKIYSFHAGDLDLKKGDSVMIQTENGPTIAWVATDVREAHPSLVPANLKNILRKTTPEDRKIKADNDRLECEARAFCLVRIHERNLPMKLVGVECLFDRSKVIFYFTAENRVDFRELVKDLVQKFRSRIELRQIAARQEARLIKGLGICGREVCCATFLQNLDRVSVKMAKEQSMSLNPEKISGLCGRLMCCLAFEHETYLDMKRDMPKCGKVIQTPEGRGRVTRQNVFEGQITVMLEGGKEITLNVTDL